MLERLKESEDFARYVDDSDEFVSFIGEKIGLGEEGVMRDYLGFIKKMLERLKKL